MLCLVARGGAARPPAVAPRAAAAGAERFGRRVVWRRQSGTPASDATTVAAPARQRAAPAPRCRGDAGGDAEPAQEGSDVEVEEDAAAKALAEMMAAEGLTLDDFQGLLAEEDETVPGTYQDAMNGNTRLGKAVRAACEELNHLNGMELQMIEQADAVLKKLGVKTSLVSQAEAVDQQGSSDGPQEPGGADESQEQG